MDAATKINALLKVINAKSALMVSRTKARAIAAAMNGAAGGDCGLRRGAYYLYTVDVDGVGQLRLTVDVDGDRGCAVKFVERHERALVSYLDSLDLAADEAADEAAPADGMIDPPALAKLDELRRRTRAILAREKFKPGAPSAPTTTRSRKLTSRQRLEVQLQARAAARKDPELRRHRGYRSC